MNAKQAVAHLESSRTPETSHGFHDCFPQNPRQSTAVREVCFKEKLSHKKVSSRTKYSKIQEKHHLISNTITIIVSFFFTLSLKERVSDYRH